MALLSTEKKNTDNRLQYFNFVEGTKSIVGTTQERYSSQFKRRVCCKKQGNYLKNECHRRQARGPIVRVNSLL